MDPSKLSRLRILLINLIEQLAEPDFDVLSWSEIVNAIQEIDDLSSDLAVGRVLTVEGDQVVDGHINKTGRVYSWRPAARTPNKSTIFHPHGGGDLCEALWNARRRPECIGNLRRWVRHVRHLENPKATDYYLGVVIDGDTVRRHGKAITMKGNELQFVKELYRAGDEGLSRQALFEAIFPDAQPNAFDAAKKVVNEKLADIDLHVRNLRRGVWRLDENYE